MYYCEPCRAKRDWPDSMTQSTGMCELCGTVACCWDRPSRYLPASPVQGAASAACDTCAGTGWVDDPHDIEHGQIRCSMCAGKAELTQGAASSASGAKGAAVKPWRERMATYTSADRALAAVMEAADAEIADLRALTDRSPAVQPVAGQAQAQPSGAVAEILRVLLANVGWDDCTDDQLRAYAAQDSLLAPAILKARAFLATPAPEQEAAPLDLAALIDECREAVTYWEPLRPFIEQFDAKLEQEAAPKCPRCKDTGTWTYTEEPGDHGDEYPCMDCGVADAKEAAENLAALLRGLECRPELAEAGADFLFKLGQAIATQAKKAPDAGAAPQPKGESNAS